MGPVSNLILRIKNQSKIFTLCLTVTLFFVAQIYVDHQNSQARVSTPRPIELVSGSFSAILLAYILFLSLRHYKTNPLSKNLFRILVIFITLSLVSHAGKLVRFKVDSIEQSQVLSSERISNIEIDPRSSYGLEVSDSGDPYTWLIPGQEATSISFGHQKLFSDMLSKNRKEIEKVDISIMLAPCIDSAVANVKLGSIEKRIELSPSLRSDGFSSVPLMDFEEADLLVVNSNKVESCKIPGDNRELLFGIVFSSMK